MYICPKEVVVYLVPGTITPRWIAASTGWKHARMITKVDIIQDAGLYPVSYFTPSMARFDHKTPFTCVMEHMERNIKNSTWRKFMVKERKET